jgi:hypothetical protein
VLGVGWPARDVLVLAVGGFDNLALDWSGPAAPGVIVGDVRAAGVPDADDDRVMTWLGRELVRGCVFAAVAAETCGDGAAD